MKYLILLLLLINSCSSSVKNVASDLIEVNKKMEGFKLIEDEKYDEAVIEFKKEFETDSNNFSLPLGLFYAYENINKLDSAKYWIIKSLNIDSGINNISSRFLLGALYEKKRNYDSAIYQYRIGLKIDPAYIDLRYKLSKIYLLKNKKELAKIELQNIYQTDSNFLDVIYLLESIKK